ncbi:NACHT, LRR and PYD domains-containing protein 3-like isoform X2 [Balamuthia mandrillaris]
MSSSLGDAAAAGQSSGSVATVSPRKAVPLNYAEAKKVYLAACVKLHTQPVRAVVALFEKQVRQRQPSVVFNLAHKGLDSKSVTALCSTLTKFNTIPVRSLELNNNNIDKRGCKALAALLRSSRTLTQLDLSENKLGDQGVKLLAEGVGRAPALITLNLRDNDITDLALVDLAPALLQTSTLEELNLGNNPIKGSKVPEFVAALEKNCTLVTLNLSNTHISAEHADAFLKLLRTSGSLTTVELKGARMSETNLAAITEASRKHSKWRNQFYNALKQGRDAGKQWAAAYSVAATSLGAELQEQKSSDLQIQLAQLDAFVKEQIPHMKITLTEGVNALRKTMLEELRWIEKNESERDKKEWMQRVQMEREREELSQELNMLRSQLGLNGGLVKGDRRSSLSYSEMQSLLDEERLKRTASRREQYLRQKASDMEARLNQLQEQLFETAVQRRMRKGMQRRQQRRQLPSTSLASSGAIQVYKGKNATDADDDDFDDLNNSLDVVEAKTASLVVQQQKTVQVVEETVEVTQEEEEEEEGDLDDIQRFREAIMVIKEEMVELRQTTFSEMWNELIVENEELRRASLELQTTINQLREKESLAQWDESKEREARRLLKEKEKEGKGELKEKEKEIILLRNALKKLELEEKDKEDQLREHYEELLREKDLQRAQEQERTLQELRDKNTELETERKRLNERMEQLKQLNAELLTAAEEKDKRSKHWEKEAKEKEERLQALQETLREREEKEKERLEAESARWRESQRDLEAEAREKDLRIEELTVKLEMKERKWEGLREEYETRLRDMKELSEGLYQRKVKGFHEELTAKTEEINELSKRLKAKEEVEESFAKAKAELKEQTAALEELRLAYQAQAKSLAKAEAALSAASSCNEHFILYCTAYEETRAEEPALRHHYLPSGQCSQVFLKKAWGCCCLNSLFKEKFGQRKGRMKPRFDETALRLMQEEVPSPLVESFLLCYKDLLPDVEDAAKCTYLCNFWKTSFEDAALKGDSSFEHVSARMIRFMRLWVEHFPSDLTTLQWAEVAKCIETHCSCPLVNEFKLLLLKTAKQLRSKAAASSPATPSTPASPRALHNPLTIKELSPKVIAAELTRHELALFVRIPVREFLVQGWQKAKTTSPNISAFIRQFNAVSFWVTTQILMRDSIEEQTQTIKKLLKAARLCLELHNFNTCIEIISGLNNSFVQRQKLAWKGLSDKDRNRFHQMDDLLQPHCNFAKYRQTFEKTELPKLPYFALLLRDITFILDGNEKYSCNNQDDEGGSINLERIEMLGSMLKSFQELQLQSPLYLPKLRSMMSGAITSMSSAERLVTEGEEDNIIPSLLFDEHQTNEDAENIREYFMNLQYIDDDEELCRLSYRLHPASENSTPFATQPSDSTIDVSFTDSASSTSSSIEPDDSSSFLDPERTPSDPPASPGKEGRSSFSSSDSAALIGNKLSRSKYALERSKRKSSSSTAFAPPSSRQAKRASRKTTSSNNSGLPSENNRFATFREMCHDLFHQNNNSTRTYRSRSTEEDGEGVLIDKLKTKERSLHLEEGTSSSSASASLLLSSLEDDELGITAMEKRVRAAAAASTDHSEEDSQKMKKLKRKKRRMKKKWREMKHKGSFFLSHSSERTAATSQQILFKCEYETVKKTIVLPADGTFDTLSRAVEEKLKLDAVVFRVLYNPHHSLRSRGKRLESLDIPQERYVQVTRRNFASLLGTVRTGGGACSDSEEMGNSSTNHWNEGRKGLIRLKIEKI